MDWQQLFAIFSIQEKQLVKKATRAGMRLLRIMSLG
jgi:hypothetical protein